MSDLLGVVVGGALALSGTASVERFKASRERRALKRRFTVAVRLFRDDLWNAEQATRRAVVERAWWPGSAVPAQLVTASDREAVLGGVEVEIVRRLLGASRRFRQIDGLRAEALAAGRTALTPLDLALVLAAQLDLEGARIELARVEGLEPPARRGCPPGVDPALFAAARRVADGEGHFAVDEHGAPVFHADALFDGRPLASI